MPSVDDDEDLKRSCTRFLHWHGPQVPGRATRRDPGGHAGRPLRRGRRGRRVGGRGRIHPGQAGGRLPAQRHDGAADRAADPRRPTWAAARSCSIRPVTSTCTRAAGTSGSTVSSAVRWARATGSSHSRIFGMWPSPRPRSCWSCRSVTSAVSSPTGTTCARRSTGRTSAALRRTWTGRACGSAAPPTDARWPRSRPLRHRLRLASTRRSAGSAAAASPAPRTPRREVREWRRRHGGTLFALWPYAASDLAALRTRLPRMAAYHEHAAGDRRGAARGDRRPGGARSPADVDDAPAIDRSMPRS